MHICIIIQYISGTKEQLPGKFVKSGWFLLRIYGSQFARFRRGGQSPHQFDICHPPALEMRPYFRFIQYCSYCSPRWIETYIVSSFRLLNYIELLYLNQIYLVDMSHIISICHSNIGNLSVVTVSNPTDSKIHHQTTEVSLLWTRQPFRWRGGWRDSSSCGWPSRLDLSDAYWMEHQFRYVQLWQIEVGSFLFTYEVDVRKPTSWLSIGLFKPVEARARQWCVETSESCR